MQRWAVSWIDKGDLAKVTKAAADQDGMTSDEYVEMNGICDLFADAESASYFTSHEAALAFAKKVLPKDAVGEVRINEEMSREIDPHDGGPNLIDWEPAGDTEFIS